MRAIGKNIIVSKQEPETTTAGGIIFTDNSRATQAQVVAVGDEVASVAVGEKLIINWSAANPVKLDTKTVYIVSIDNVFAVV
jgi:co-chaperonin GroES (HSP10)